MLEKESDIQGIVNITPDHQHGSINISALKKGKAAISHKPLASVALRSAARRCELARDERGAVAPAGLQQHAGPAHARSVDQRRRHRHRARGAQLDQPSVLAAGLAGVLRVGSAGARRLQLGRCGRARAGSSVSPELHVLPLSRLVRLRRRLPRRHGLLQPVAAVPHPESGRARSSSRRGRTTTRSSTRSTSATAATSRWSACRKASTVRWRHPATANRPSIDTFWYDGGMKPQTPEELYEDKRGSRRRGHAVHRRQGQDPVRFPRQQAAADSAEPPAGVRRIGRRAGHRHDHARTTSGSTRSGTGRSPKGSFEAGRRRSAEAVDARRRSRCACPTSGCCGTRRRWSSPTRPEANKLVRREQ